ncbi:MAG: fatty acid--CoA ligase, partial [Acidiferrobacterales bacterium]
PHDGETAGEVVVRAPALTQAYLKNPDASEKLWQGGYLHTGDIGNIDADGYLKVTDRVKDVIKSGGEWISSLTLEDIVSQHPNVNEVAAIAVPDEKWGERPMLLVVLNSGLENEVSEHQIRVLVQAQADKGVISRWAVPDRIQFVEVIEKTSVGKIDKKRLREKYS